MNGTTRLLLRTIALAGTAAVLACEGGGSAGPTAADPGASDPAVPAGNAALGAARFVEACAPCHASRDGFDLAHFSMPDTAIVRRALPHVDAETAANIAAHVTSLDVPTAPRGSRPFQPGGALLVDDVAFAVRSFGGDGWPEGLSTAQLRAVDPVDVPVAVAFPVWSVEGSNVDWMPDAPLPEAVLERRGGVPRRALETYYARPGLDRLILAVQALRGADRDRTAAGAPCERLVTPNTVRDPATCFEVRRWTSTLAAQHLLRVGETRDVPTPFSDAWWDVGNAARLSGRGTGTIANREANWASWMMLGWVFDPGRHASVYTGNAMMNLDLPRHATFVALRSAVARPAGSVAPYTDVANAARFAPEHWLVESTAFGLTHLVERLRAGERPADVAEARQALDRTILAASRRLGPGAERLRLANLRAEILTLLDDG